MLTEITWLLTKHKWTPPPHGKPCSISTEYPRSTEQHWPMNNLHGQMEDYVLFPGMSCTWAASLFAHCLKVIALCRAAAADAGGRGETEDRRDSQWAIQQHEKKGNHNSCQLFMCPEDNYTTSTVAVRNKVHLHSFIQKLFKKRKWYSGRDGEFKCSHEAKT